MEHEGWIKANTEAVVPLNDAGILLVSAAGNERMDMDELHALGYSYSPCLIQVGGSLVRLRATPGWHNNAAG